MKRFFYDHSILLTLLLVLSVMLMIFLFSAQTAQESAEESGKIVQWIITNFYRDYEKMDPDQQLLIREFLSHLIRKAAHFTEYLLLGFSLLLHFLSLRNRWEIRFPKLASQMIGSLYAVTDELHQTLVSGRSGQLSDVFLDSAGVLFGILALLLIIALIRRRRRRQTAVTLSH